MPRKFFLFKINFPPVRTGFEPKRAAQKLRAVAQQFLGNLAKDGKVSERRRRRGQKQEVFARRGESCRPSRKTFFLNRRKVFFYLKLISTRKNRIRTEESGPKIASSGAAIFRKPCQDGKVSERRRRRGQKQEVFARRGESCRHSQRYIKITGNKEKENIKLTENKNLNTENKHN
ncbi:MAG: hypothetical protein K5866_09540 [Treponema sp.]|nr:hypothetical protein [Treponema sp.]